MRNLTNEKVQCFIESHIEISKNTQREMEVFAEENGIPIITKDTLSLIKSLIMIHKPKHILEFGTAIGYSAIEMVKASDNTSHVTTIERDEKRYEIAKEYIVKSGNENNIRTFCGDALIFDDYLDIKYDMVFIDAAKGQYKKFFDKAYENTGKGGIIISDNIFHNAMVCETEIGLVKRRQRTIYRRMNDYIKFLTSTEGLYTTLIPIGDGIAITIINGE